ncbi:MAG: hypothetical protein U0802_07830 [Candidatus Binatia bacterium]
MRALAAALDEWQPGQPGPRIPAPGDLAPIGTMQDASPTAPRRRRPPRTPGADVGCRSVARRGGTAARDAERNLEALGAAEETARHAVQRVEHAQQLASTAR